MYPHHQAVRGKKGGLSVQHVYPDHTLTRFKRARVMKEKVKRDTGGSQAFVCVWGWHLQMRDTPIQLQQASEWRPHLRLYPHPLSPLPHLCETGKTGNSTNQQAAPGNSPRLSPRVRLRHVPPPPPPPLTTPLPARRSSGLSMPSTFSAASPCEHPAVPESWRLRGFLA